MFWGSSGFGKTETIRAYAKDEGMELLTRNAVYLDPLNCWLPRFDEENGYVVDRPHQWVHKVLTAKAPLVLYLDELTRCRSVQIMNMLTELLLDRTFNGHPISEHVQIICATNLYEEDVALVEVPDAVMNRMFHFIFAPDASESALNMRTELGRTVLTQQPNILDVPGIPEFTLKGNPRAVDDIVDLWETTLLSEADLKLCCQMRIGKEKGAVCAATILDITKKREMVLPSKLTYAEFPRVAKADHGGMGIEVVNLLKVTVGDEKKKPTKAMRMVADYLIQYATAETCRAMQMARFYYEYNANEIPKEADDSDIVNVLDGRKLIPGMPVQYYLLAKKKLSDGTTEAQK
jgi:hypothetical protein